MYGKDLTLTFEGEDKHTTYIGATLTAFIVFFILIYTSFQLETMFKRNRTTVNLKTIYEDLTQNYQNISLQDGGFDFALQLSKRGDPIYDETYFRYVVENTGSWWGPDANGIIKRFKVKDDLEMQPCTYYAGDQAEVTKLGIYQSFHCPKKKEYSIAGAFTSNYYRYIYIKIEK